MLKDAGLGGDPRIELASFAGLLADFAQGPRCDDGGARAARGRVNFEYEFQMALMNRKLNGELETVFLVPRRRPDLSLLVDVVREVARFGGPLDGLVSARGRRRAARQRFGT